MLTTFCSSDLYVKDSFIKSNASRQISESGVTERDEFILIRPHLLSGEGKYSGRMICCISYITTQISSRRREDNDGGGKRQKANKEPAFELTKHMYCSCRR